MKNRILLFYGSVMSLTGKIACSQPLSIMALSAVLKKQGYRVDLLDGQMCDSVSEEIARLMGDDLVFAGISCKTGPALNAALTAAATIRKAAPSLPIVWGGYHVSTLPEQSIKHPLVDVIAVGTAEKIIVPPARLLQEDVSRRNLDGIPGLMYKDIAGVVHKTGDPVPLEDINEFPLMDYSVLADRVAAGYKVDSINYLSSRGCPHACKFCAIKTFYRRRWFTLDPKRVTDDIEYLTKKFGISSISFLDDNFFVKRERVVQIFSELDQRKIQIRWDAFCRVDYFSKFDDEFISFIKKHGITFISFGGESGSPRILSMIAKGITPEATRVSVEKCRKWEIECDFSFITGFPGESIADFRESIELFREMYKADPNCRVRLFSYTPYPGTELFEEAVKHGYRQPNTMEEWAHEMFQGDIKPWVGRQHGSLIKILNWMLFFTPTKQYPQFSSRIAGFLSWLLHLDAMFRMKHKLFAFAFEWKLLYFLQKRHYTSKHQ